ncbi:hypothetical protein M1614_01530 [Candidatus Marsarchaeota archaeon]|jgi:hypothetical protein|nr:hypothetical protein [Candidatus Marsarchaeota archaeon]MCL5089713.1 hypothetical protein [Candidatus Marsarchaeota archaeon]
MDEKLRKEIEEKQRQNRVNLYEYIIRTSKWEVSEEDKKRLKEQLRI